MCIFIFVLTDFVAYGNISNLHSRGRTSLLHCGGDHALEQVAQQGYGVSLTGDHLQFHATCSSMTLLEQGVWII